MNRTTIFTLSTLAATILAVFAPWATVLGIASAGPVSGGDAVILIPAVLITALLVWRWPHKLITPIVSFLTAALMTLEIVTVLDSISGAELATPAWGIYMAGITTAALYVASIMLFILRRSLRRERRVAVVA